MLGREVSTLSDEWRLGYTTSRTYGHHGHENADHNTHNRLVQTLSRDLFQMYQVTSTMELKTMRQVLNPFEREVVQWTDSSVITRRAYDPGERSTESKVAIDSELLL